MLLLLFGFNLSRGISSAAWLPWIASLIPEAVRGKFLAREAGWVNTASCVSFLLSALCLGRSPQSWQFAVLFAFSAAMGAVSLVFLKRIPDAAPPGEVRASKAPVPWREMLRYRPFRRLLRTVAAWSVAYGGMQAFTVAFLKTEVGMTEGAILLITSVSYLGGLGSLWFLGSRLDWLGSKPVLRVSFAVWLLALAGWLLLAGRVLAPQLAVLLALHVLMGLFASLVQMSHTRLVMAIIPVLGRNHFFAIYSVLGSLALGLAPIGWGLLIDAIGGWQAVWLGVAWNRYAVFFAAVALVLCLALALATRLEEPKAASLETLLREVLIESPQRVLVRLWPR
jgi:MFS family permease